ncbi:malonic semialdehyde reductase RutE [Candidatus Tiddalikarchaeum anstoanum]|nr:malonic semialdehyde reductase RutE [Candidatus Tiddalikarchaeum anstoanum]
MDALKAINTRRSIRKYKQKKISIQTVKKLIGAARNAPSSFNEQSWVFITVTNKETKEKLAEHKSQKSKFMKDAPLIIACCYDTTKTRTKAHNLENVAVASENILVAANALGLGACYVGGFDPEYPEIEDSINIALKLPSNIKIVCLITIGYPDEKPAKKSMRPISEVWKMEKY